jgi:hypothetical protein
MNNDQVNRFKPLWTTQAHEYFLLRFTAYEKEQLLIYRITPTSMGSFVIEDDEIYDAVKQKMLKAGNQIIGREYVLRLRDERRTNLR